MELTIEHLAPYPYGLKVMVFNIKRNLTAISLDSPFVFTTIYKGGREKQMFNIKDVKPILHPLSDLTKPITVDGYNEGKEFVPIVELARIGTGHAINEGYELGKTGVIKWSRYYFGINENNDFSFFADARGGFYEIRNQRQLFELLYKWHFDLEKLIDDNLAIDINTLKK